MFDLQYEVDSLTKIRDKTINNDTPARGEKNHNLPYHGCDIHKIDAEIAATSTELDHAKTSFAIIMWVFGMLLAIIPASIFAYFGLGILKMSGMINVNIPIYDTILNAVFIGSGTKPIHDAIDALMSIKKG